MSGPFNGMITACITPFAKDGTIDYGTWRRLIDRQIRAGADGLVIFGTAGEAPTITPSEYLEALERVVDMVGGRVPVLAGAGGNDTRRAVTQAKAVAETGIDGLLVTCPYYSKPPQHALVNHYRAIADAVALPQLVYNIKGRTGVNIDPDTLFRMAEHENIVGVKEASDDMDQFMTVAGAAPDGFSVLAGSDHVAYPVIAFGGHGVICTVSNIIPADFKALVTAALEGNRVLAARKHALLLPLMKACFIENNPMAIKTMMALAGEIEEVFRPPLCSMLPENREVLRSILQRFALLPGTVAAA